MVLNSWESGLKMVWTVTKTKKEFISNEFEHFKKESTGARRRQCCSLWSNKRNAGGLHDNEWPLTLLPTPRWHIPYLISLYDVGVSGAGAEKSPLCIMKIDYTWIDYRMAQEVSWNPIVFIMSQSHSVIKFNYSYTTNWNNVWTITNLNFIKFKIFKWFENEIKSKITSVTELFIV